MEVTLANILKTDFCQKHETGKINLYVNNQPVWDFKVQDGKLKLIHETVKSSETYGIVTLSEIKKYVTLEEAELPVKSETDPREISEIEGLVKGSEIGLNFVLV